MQLSFINTGTSANKGDGDTLRLAFTKINGNLATIQSTVKTEEEIRDLTGNMLASGAKAGVSIEYNTVTNLVSVAVEPASTSTIGGVKAGHNVVIDDNAVLTAISSFTGITPPDSPIEGDQWWDPQSGRGYVYFEGAWVEYSPTSDLVLPLTDVPASSSAPGKFGEVAVDHTGLYICVADNVWKRITWDSNW